ncbi:glycosyltransferase family 4 protein [Haloterrigena alkaliphila]|uniref:Glycosyltransferase family 4 protein n=1 Tax=Haloterrigena alkaliphila TaxID=2816475 RepID=A0A8A2VGC3_9EURY|nr:glycosyltransferase family 4 protein [Haloterrigena alkaliphila]QSX01194.1 glycosyltransferase family 4 protein [Haloterrigena alkaliphila]
MDIAFVSNVVFPFVKGGAEKRIHEIGTRLAAEGHDVTVYGRHYWDGPQVMEYEGLTLYGVAPAKELYDDERRSITEAIDFSVRLLPHLRRNVDDHDVIVASLFPYFPVLASKLTTLRTDTPLITTWHEVWLDYWDEYLGRLAPFGKAIERLTAKTPHYPIAISSVTADRLTEIGSTRDEIEIVPNGIDVKQIETTQPAEDGFDILYAGRLIEHKNVDLLLEAFDRIAETAPNITLGIIGDGPERDSLERQAQNLNHADRVTMLGFLEEYDDVLAHMRAADIFASPSTREGFGITFAEAMAADCTVIAADHPESAASEVIDDAGFLVSPTVDDVTAVLERALSGDRPNTEPTTRAQRYDWDTVAEQAEQCYQRAIDGNW